MEINGIRVGECGNEAMMAGDYGFPCVMISGDTAVCREMQELLGDIEIAPVNVGYGLHHADCLHPNVARQLIQEKTRTALERLEDFRPFAVPGPTRLVQRLKKPYAAEALQAYSTKPYTEVMDEHTVVFKGRNVVEAFARRCGVEVR